jgi:hypothetical protein
MKMLSPEIQYPADRARAPQRRQSVVQTRDARQSRHGHAAAVYGAHDDARDNGRTVDRKEARGHAPSSYGATGGHSCGVEEAKRRGRHWRRPARTMGVVRLELLGRAGAPAVKVRIVKQRGRAHLRLRPGHRPVMAPRRRRRRRCRPKRPKMQTARDVIQLGISDEIFGHSNLLYRPERDARPVRWIMSGRPGG